MVKARKVLHAIAVFQKYTQEYLCFLKKFFREEDLKKTMKKKVVSFTLSRQ